MINFRIEGRSSNRSSVLNLCMQFLADMGPGSWQQGTGVRERSSGRSYFAVNPNAVWKSLLEPTVKDTFSFPRARKYAANIWGDVLMQNTNFKKDGRWHRTLSTFVEDVLPLQQQTISKEK